MIVYAKLRAVLVLLLVLVALGAPIAREGALAQRLVQSPSGSEPELMADFGPARDLALHGDHLVAAAGLRILTLDAKVDPPTIVARSEQLPGVATRVVVDGDHAFVGLGEAGLAVVHLVEGAMLPLVGTVSLPGTVRDLLLDGDRLFVAAGDAGLRVVDVSDPGAPREVARLAESQLATLGDAVWGLAMDGERLVLSGQGFLALIDVQGGRGLEVVGALHGQMVGSSSVVAAEGYAYQPGWPVQVFDIRDPEAIRVVYGAPEDDLLWLSLETSEVLLQGTQLYLGGMGFVTRLDLEEPARPMPRASWWFDDAYAYTSSLAVIGERVHATSDAGLLTAIFPEHGGGLVELSRMLLWADMARIDLGEGFAAIVDMEQLRIVDLRDSLAPRVVAEEALDSVRDSYAIDLAGDRLAIGGSFGSLMEVWDVSDRTQPEVVGVHQVASGEGPSALVSGVAVGSGEVFATVQDDAGTSFVVFGVEESGAIVERARLVLDGRASLLENDSALALVGDIALVSFVHQGEQPIVVAIDVSRPAMPTEVRRIQLRAAQPWEDPFGMTLIVDGSRAYVGDKRESPAISVLDITEATNPVEIAAIARDPWTEFVVEDARLYVAKDNGDVEVHDLTDPDEPRSLSRWRGGEESLWQLPQLAVQDGLLVAISEEGFYLLDGRTPMGPPNARAPQLALGESSSMVLSQGRGVLSGGGRLLRFELDDLGRPRIGAEALELTAFDLAILEDGKTVLATVEGELRLIDITGGQPRVRGALPLVASGYAVLDARRDHAAVVSTTSFAHYDLSSPDAPVLLGEIELQVPEALGQQPFFASVALGEHSALVAMRTILREDRPDGTPNFEPDWNLLVIDLVGPESPRLAQVLDVEGEIEGLAFMDDGRHGLVLDDVPRLTVLDAADADGVNVVGRQALPRGGGRLATAGSWAWVTEGWSPSAVRGVDLSDPSHPRLAGMQQLPGRPYGIEEDDGRVVVLDHIAGVVVLGTSFEAHGSSIILPHVLADR